MNKKDFMMKSARFLAGLMTVATVATPIIGSASTLHFSGEVLNYKMGKYTSSGIDWSPYARFDSFGEYTLDGEVVWCMEPSIKTDDGYSYHSDGEDAIRNGVTVRSIGGSTNTAGAYYVKLASFYTWLIYKASDSELNQIKDLVRNESYGSDFISNIDYIRRLGKNAKWTASQLMIWYSITFVTVKDVSSANNSEMNDVFKWYADSTGTGIDQLLYRPVEKTYRALEREGMIEYTGGFKIYSSDVTVDTNLHGSGPAQAQFSNGGNFRLLETKRPIKIRKEFANLNNGVSNKPNFNPAGIKFGVYSDVEATQKVGELTLDQNGDSNTLKVKRGTYYGYELDQNGNPIKTGAQEVVNGTDATKGYVSGKDKASQNKYVTWEVGQGGSEDPVMATFENMPEVVNFTFKKEIKDDNIKALEALDPQYKREGAVYTLYSDANASQKVTKNGQPVTATIDAQGNAKFEGLYRGVYYVKETDVPKIEKNGRKIKRFALDSKVYKVDLTTMNDNEKVSNNSTVTVTKEFTKQGAFSSEEPTTGRNNLSLVIKKKDAENKNNKAQGQATLQGAEFKIEFYEMQTLNTNKPVKKWEAVYKTDANGEVDIRNRDLMVSSTNTEAMNKLFNAYQSAGEWGAFDYRVTETKSPDGYKLASPNPSKDFVVKNPQNYEQNNFVWEYDDGSVYNKDLELHLIKTQRASGDWLPQAEADKILIANANFELTNKKTNQKFTAKTDAQGKLKFDGVIAGEYTLRETSVDKYLTNGQVIDLTIAQQDGTTKLTASSTSKPTDTNAPYSVNTNNDGDIEVKYQNSTKPVKGKLIKANEKGDKLQGAKFKLVHYGEDGTTKVDEKELTTNAKGEFEFNELTVGHWYTLEEIQAPDGYKLPAKRKTVKFRAESIPAKNSYALSYQISELDKTNENNTKAVTGDVKKISAEGKMVDGIKFDANETEGTMALEFDVVNNTWQKLPATGSMYGALAGGAALVVVIGSLVFYVKKRED